VPHKQTREVTSIAQIIEYLSEDLADQKQIVWYRGQFNKNWTLTPSIYRRNVKTDLSEMHLLKHFKQDASSLFKPNNMPSHDWLFIMRHYGVPTRLLDWTESVLIATYFATEKNNVDGAIWMLLPIVLNQQEGRQFTNIDKSLPSFEENGSIMREYEPREDLETQKNIQLNPMAFICPRNIARMQAQRSVYTIHHLRKTPIERIGDMSHVWQYIIPKEAKQTIRQQLTILGINDFQIFPEAEYVAKKLLRACKK
jgi:hypothetical protein